MSSRAKILAAVKANLPEPSQLPELKEFLSPDGMPDKVSRFIRMAQSVSSEATQIQTNEVERYIQNHLPAGRQLSYSNYLGDQSEPIGNPHQLDSVEVAIIDARFGVIENGAVWVDDDSLGIRALPFICQHLVVLLKEDDLVENMNDAYLLINKEPMPSYGLFIAGPSKTADIEQALVLGAHGSLSNTILLIP